MSILAIPRLYFKGVASWDPPTTNNNDQWPTYDFTNAAFNWGYLSQQNPPITPDNFQTQFPKWAQTLQFYNPGGGTPGWYQPPAEWNYYGGSNISLVSPDQKNNTTIQSGQIAYGSDPITDDNVVGAQLNLQGDCFPGSTSPTSARMVDINPGAFWSTDFYLRSVSLGDSDSPFLKGEVVPGSRMSSRWMNVQRNLNIDNGLEIAGTASIVVQCCLPNELLQLNSQGSFLMEQLDDARQSAQGIMIRYVAYMTQYFTKEEFAGCNGLTEQYTRLTSLWAAALHNNKTPIQNPAFSYAIGSIGLWYPDELISVPGGRYLFPQDQVTPSNVPQPSPVGMGPAAIEVHEQGAETYVCVDMSSTIPEINSQGVKADLGTISLKVTGNNTPIATLSPDQYNQSAYEARSGVMEFPLPDGLTVGDIVAGHLYMEVEGKTGLAETALSDAAISVQTDQRGVYVNQSGEGRMYLQVRMNGHVPTQPVNILLQQYLPSPAPPAGGQAWTLPTATQHEAIAFNNAPGNIITVPAGTIDPMEISFSAIRPGFPIVVFFPYLADEAVPVPPSNIIPVLTPGGTLTVASAFYGCVRVLPFDDGLPQAFANLWNCTHDRTKAWNFVYHNILYIYDMLYPVMRFYTPVHLGDQQAVDEHIDLILQLTSARMELNTLYMPVTRELSFGKRTVLEMYGALVQGNWEAKTISPPSASPA